MLIEGTVFSPRRQHPGQSRRDRGAMRGGACRPGLASSQVLRSCPKQPHAFLPLGFPFGFEFSAKLCILFFCSECVPQLCCLLVVEEGPLWVPEDATQEPHGRWEATMVCTENQDRWDGNPEPGVSSCEAGPRAQADALTVASR